MWFDRLLPEPLRAPGIYRLSDIPVEFIEPPGLYCAYYECDLSFEDRACRAHRRSHTFAATEADPWRARFLCMMEGVERVSGLSAEVMARLAGPGVLDLDLSEFWSYSTEQWREIEAAGLPEAPVWRVHARGLCSDRRYAIPADAVFPWWRSFSGRRHPLPEGDGGGFAAGFSWDYSSLVERALREVIERDAVMMAWRYNAWPARRLELSRFARIDPGWLEASGLTLKLYDVGDPRLEPVVIALLHGGADQGGAQPGGVVVGCSCRASLCDAADKALSEALMLHGTARLLDSEKPALAPEDVNDSGDHIVFAWRNSQAVIDWFAAKDEPAPQARIPGDLPERCRRYFGLEPMIVDVTHPALARLNLRAARVVQPRAAKKEYRHVWRYLGDRRPAGALEDFPNELPHPVG